MKANHQQKKDFHTFCLKLTDDNLIKFLKSKATMLLIVCQARENSWRNYVGTSNFNLKLMLSGKQYVTFRVRVVHQHKAHTTF